MPAIKVSYLYRRTLPALSAVLLLAMPPPSPASGIKTWNRPVCGGVRCRALLPHGGAMTGAVMNRRYRSPCRREFLAGTAGSALHWEKNRLRLRPQGPAAGPHIGGRIS